MLLRPKAAKAFQKIDNKNQERIKQALRELAVDPYKAGEQLHPAHFWKTRAGDYRAIYEINKDKKEVIVLFVGHRKNVYGNFTKIL
ncbi:MAG: type II toxin-antitoxin system RelE/ParE family toxin [Candidatus Bathyarchaeota archaeon]|nr:type II toxin-antitoxin system RelE/ParE family toxin [Candidatus Bathyarchaeota archaeon]